VTAFGQKGPYALARSTSKKSRRLTRFTGPIHIPAELAPVVQGVFGLDNRAQAVPHCRHAAAAAKKRNRSASPTFTPADLAALYEFPHELDGRGQTIALVELGGGIRMPDVADYFRSLGHAVPTVLAVSVDGAHNAPGGQRHESDHLVMLDLAIAAVLAPAAKIVIYFAPNTARGFVDAVSTAVHDRLHRPTILSISWGAPEKTWTHQAMRAVDEAFQEAALLGVTVVVASGDDGARGHLDDGLAHVDFPASSPHALACGGTRIEHSKKDRCPRAPGGPAPRARPVGV
jgi:kumamolisin